jgi:hypothetical protein
LIERERMRVMAQDYVSRRNANIAVEQAREYHGQLTAYATGEKRR